MLHRTHGAQDVLAAAKAGWDEAGCGFPVDLWFLQVRACDTWLFATSRADLSARVLVLRHRARYTAGLELRLERYTWAIVTRPGWEPKATGHDMDQLPVTQHAPACSCLKVLGASFKFDGEHREEFKSILASVWKFYHSKTPLWRARGSWKDKVHAMHRAIFPVPSWYSGSRRWTS